MEELVRRGIQGVPAILVGDELVVGFDPGRVEELLRHDIIPCEQCGSKLRVPSGKGAIRLTCPRCGHKFVTRS